MGAAVIGLVGVLVGAVANGALTWVNARGERRQKVRTAARMVRWELLQYRELLQWFLSGNSWESHLWTSPTQWNEKGSVLADACSADEWSRLETAYLGLQILDGWSRPLPNNEGYPPVAPPRSSGVDTIVKHLSAAIASLGPLADVEPDEDQPSA